MTSSALFTSKNVVSPAANTGVVFENTEVNIIVNAAKHIASFLNILFMFLVLLS